MTSLGLDNFYQFAFVIFVFPEGPVISSTIHFYFIGQPPWVVIVLFVVKGI